MTMEKHQITTSGMRLDQYLVKENLCPSRSVAAKLIKDGCIKLNGKPAKASAVTSENDVLQITRPKIKTSELVPKPVTFDVVYEDEHLIVVNKPSGLVVHPGAGHYEESLVHGLLYHCKDLSGIGGVERPGIVHRLDKGTSGLMVVAKSDRAHIHLSDQFKDKKVKKIYLALVLGKVEKKQQRLENLMKRAEQNRKKFVVNQKKGKTAITTITVLQQNERVSLVQADIETGRTHQIRVHLHHIHHPILGDDIYGGTKKLKGLPDDEQIMVKQIGHQLLHARFLSFEHPVSHKEMTFTQEVPQDFLDVAKHFFPEGIQFTGN